ncbi:MAG: CbbQ/NirQ/NorQ C-terminal domain-containing protein [Asticcacaulis sp.]|nr:CbbQ/NirQ/NorQ C-terminal domain-containing protein [Asticcacaulis sp.]
MTAPATKGTATAAKTRALRRAARLSHKAMPAFGAARSRLRRPLSASPETRSCSNTTRNSGVR